jgi:hypothetical protein
MNRRGLILSVLALGVAGFGGATWFATRPGPVAEAEPVAPELAEAMIRPSSDLRRRPSRSSNSSIRPARPVAPFIPS